MAARPSTPPTAQKPASQPLTPEQIRRIEENRLRAKALRSQRASDQPTTNPLKRPHSATTTTTSNDRTLRDARQTLSTDDPSNSAKKPYDDIMPARKFTKYIDYDFSKMADTKGGFLTAEDDPHNKALHSKKPGEEDKPSHMTLQEWERHQLLKKLREQRAGPFEPGMSSIKGPDGKQPTCRDCGSLEIDWQWDSVFGCRVCNACKERFPEKYSLLTKTEAREDYLLTDPELKDTELLPRLEKPNPHKATWNNMQLYLRYQVEEYALSDKKWGSGEKLDEEFERREKEKKRRKEEKWKEKLVELKKRTRVEAYKRGREKGGKVGEFGDQVKRRGEAHEHEWGREVVNSEGMSVKMCHTCGMEVEELSF